MSETLLSASADLARTPLYDLHCSLGARMVPFGGYSMPVQYPSGIISEHLHTRTHAGLFDVSHMGQAILEGKNARRRLEKLVPGDLQALGPGRMRYTQLLDYEGNILDDLMVTRLDGEASHRDEDEDPDADAHERLFLVVNAGTKRADFAILAGELRGLALTVLDDHALLALQGPKAASVLSRRIPAVAHMPFMSLIETVYDGVSLRISRSGYTGEDGFEISIPAPLSARFAEDLLADEEVHPIGLGARDSLRLEAGLCLYGHDIDTTTNPIEAGLLWSISKRRREEGGFPGDERIRLAIAHGPLRRLVGLTLEGRVPAREGADITSTAGQIIGRVTSGGFSPSLGKPIAMGYVDPAHALKGTLVHLIVRGKALTAEVAAMPFVPHNYYRGA